MYHFHSRANSVHVSTVIESQTEGKPALRCSFKSSIKAPLQDTGITFLPAKCILKIAVGFRRNLSSARLRTLLWLSMMRRCSVRAASSPGSFLIELWFLFERWTAIIQLNKFACWSLVLLYIHVYMRLFLNVFCNVLVWSFCRLLCFDDCAELLELLLRLELSHARLQLFHPSLTTSPNKSSTNRHVKVSNHVKYCQI